MNKILSYAAVLFFAAVCAGPAETGKVMLDGVAAYVNEHTIAVSDVLVTIEPVRRQLTAKYGGEELRAKITQAYKDGLDILVERYLILDSCVEQKMEVPEWAVTQKADEVLRESFKDDHGALMSALNHDQLTYEQWIKQLRETMTVAMMRRGHVGERVRVNPAAVKAEYEANKARYAVPAMVHLQMIVLNKAQGDPAAAQAVMNRALEIRGRLLAGEDFSAMAASQSQDDKAEAGGDWGWIDPVKVLRAELAEALSRMEVGAVGEVVETREALYIMKVNGRREAAVASFEDVQRDIERDLRRKEEEVAYKAWIDRLKETSYVKVFDVNLF